MSYRIVVIIRYGIAYLRNVYNKRYQQQIKILCIGLFVPTREISGSSCF